MVSKRTVDWNPLTTEEQEEVAMAVYKSKFPDDDEPDEDDVRWALDDRDWDAAATPEAMAWMVVRAQELFSEGLGHPGHPRAKLRTAAINAARLAAGGDIYREDVLNAMEKAGCLPAREEAVQTVTELAKTVELVAFLPPDEPLHTADGVDELMVRLSYEQLWSLARGAVKSMAVLGMDLEWSSDHVEWVCERLVQAKRGMDLPPIADQNIAAANWWRRLEGGMDPLDELEGHEITPDQDDVEVVVWSPEDPKPFSSTVDRGRAVSLDELVKELFSSSEDRGLTLSYMHRPDAGLADPLASAAEFNAIGRTVEGHPGTVWEFVHRDDPESTRGGWAVPAPRAGASQDRYLGVRRCTWAQWADEQESSAPDQAPDTVTAVKLATTQTDVTFESGPLTHIAAYLTEPTPGGQ